MKEEAADTPRARSASRLLTSAFLPPFLLGAVSVLGYAPFSLFPLPVLCLAHVFARWRHAASPWHAAATGFSYGLGLFLAGVSWVYVSLHDFGAMPLPLAAAATLLFCMFLALLPAAAGYLAVRTRAGGAMRAALAAPALWTLAEWTRGWIFTGFPWLALGYSQIPASPLAGYAPVLGIYGVSLATAVSAGLLATLWHSHMEKAAGGKQLAARHSDRPQSGSLILHPSAFILVLLWSAGFGLGQVAWTHPAGEPLAVSLVQGNVPQDMKWRPDHMAATLDTYLRLVAAAPGRLIVLPETALPLFLDQVPADYLEALAARARANRGDLLLGIPERLPGGEYFNSVISLGSSASAAYRKSHLVPFGEFIPLRPLLGRIVTVLAIPLQDFARGRPDQQPLAVAGERAAADICYEDAFGEEIIRQLPAATLLVNVSNVAWFGRSLAPYQHLQISQARALETGRYMLRATNTGMTAIIDPRGVVVAAAPEFTTTVLTHTVQGRGGATPYVRFGNYVVLATCGLLLGCALLRRSA